MRLSARKGPRRKKSVGYGDPASDCERLQYRESVWVSYHRPEDIPLEEMLRWLPYYEERMHLARVGERE